MEPQVGDCSLPNIITKEEMWNLIDKSHEKIGIIGYNPEKKYIDPRKLKLDRENFLLDLDVWKRKCLYPKPRLPKDREGNEYVPTKKTFIDEAVRRANMYYSKEKENNYKESKGFAPFVRPLAKSNIYSHDRKTIIQQFYQEKENESKLSEVQSERAEKVKEKLADMFKPAKHWAEKLQEKYTNKSSLSKNARVSYISDAEFVGEKSAFYRDPKNEGESHKEFLPKIDLTINRSPKWKYSLPVTLNTEPIEKRNDLTNAKIEETRKKLEDKNMKELDPGESYKKVIQRGRIDFAYRKVMH